MQIWNPIGVEEFYFADEFCVVVSEGNGIEVMIHHEQSLASLRLQSKGSLSQAAKGDLIYTSSIGEERRFFYDKKKQGWQERRKAIVAPARSKKVWSVYDTKTPDGYEWDKYPIQLQAQWTSKSTREDSFDITQSLSIFSNGSFYCPEIGYVDFDRELSGNLEVDKCILAKVFASDTRYQLIVQDSTTDKYYRYECVEDPDNFLWYELFLESTEMTITNKTTGYFSYEDFFKGIIAVVLAGLFAWMINDHLELPPYHSNRASAYYIVLSIIWSPVAYCSFIALCHFCCCYQPLEDEWESSCLRVGPYNIHANGNISWPGNRMEFGDVTEHRNHNYRLTSISQHKAIVSCQTSSVEITRQCGRLQVTHCDLGPMGKYVTPYDPSSAYCNFRPDYAGHGFSFLDIPTDCGVVHSGWTGSFQASFEVGGIIFHGYGKLTFADAVVPLNDPLPQTRYRDVFITKVQSSDIDGWWWVRILQVDGEFCWYYRYEILEEHGQSIWNQMSLRRRRAYLS